MYYFKGAAYPSQREVLRVAGRDYGDTLPEDAKRLTPIFPPLQDADWQYHVFEAGVLDKDTLSYTLAITNKTQFAKVENGVVQELAENDPYSNWDSSKMPDDPQALPDDFDAWQAVPFELRNWVDVGWLLDREQFAPAQGWELWTKEYKIACIERIKQSHAENLVMLTGNATEAERGTWTLKLSAAERVIEGQQTQLDTAMLQPEADADGISTDDLALTIIGKSKQYQRLIGIASGIKASTIKAVKKAATAEEIDAILADAEEKAEQAIAQLKVA